MPGWRRPIVVPASSQQVMPFLYDMPAALREADLVVARAGAMTVAELTACGKPAILIPLPSAIYDHQTRNAEVMEAAGAAVVLPQSALTGSLLVRTVVTILRDPERLRMMGEASLSMRRIDAAEVIVRECYALMGGLMMSTSLSERQESNGIGQRAWTGITFVSTGSVE